MTKKTEIMSTKEMIGHLKSINLFQQVSMDLLEQIATEVKEKPVHMGDLIINKGEMSRDMFLIVKGRFRVHEGNVLIKELKEGDFFGEIGALSGSRRVASVSALSDGLLLRITNATVYQVMASDVNLAKELIKALCKRIEAMAIQAQLDRRMYL